MKIAGQKYIKTYKRQPDKRWRFDKQNDTFGKSRSCLTQEC